MAKTKALISCAVNAQLICVFVFALAKRRFSHDAAHIIITKSHLCDTQQFHQLYKMKVDFFFLFLTFFVHNIDCVYSLEPPSQDSFYGSFPGVSLTIREVSHI